MKLIKLFITTLVVLQLFSCTVKKTEVITNNTNDEILNTIHDSWIKCFNKGNEDLKALYTKKALLFYNLDKKINGNTEIYDFYNTQDYISKITSVVPHSRYQKSGNLIFEIGHFESDNKQFQYVIQWIKIRKIWLKDLEIITEKIDNSLDLSEIDKQREKWNKIAAEHQVSNLVEELFINNGYYYGSTKLYEGHDEIKTGYSSLKSVTINIEQEYVVKVAPDTAYEIGKYYVGGMSWAYYVLIWNKDSSQEWKIFLDAN